MLSSPARVGSPRGSISPADVTALLQDIVGQLARLGEYVEQAKAASAFLLCFCRYTTPEYLFEVLAREMAKSSYRRVGVWRMFFMWVKLRFRLDFYTSKPSGRTLFHSLLDMLWLQRRSRAPEEEMFEGNRILLLMVRYSELDSCNVIGRRSLRRRRTNSFAVDRKVMLSRLPEPSFWDHEPRDVAEQMTLIDANMLRAIRPEEFYRKGWLDPTRGRVLHLLVSRSNAISDWVASSVLYQPSNSSRSRALARFVVIAQLLEDLGNYNSLVSVIGGFHLWALNRLQGIISLPKTYRTLLSHLEFLVSPGGNYRTYRSMVASKPADKPFIPYMGLYLKDLTFIEDGNADAVHGKPNFDKIQLFGSVLCEIEQHQRSCQGYNKRITARMPQLLDHLARFPRMTEDEMSAASLYLRPSRSHSTAADTPTTGSPRTESPRVDSPASSSFVRGRLDSAEGNISPSALSSATTSPRTASSSLPSSPADGFLSAHAASAAEAAPPAAAAAQSSAPPLSPQPIVPPLVVPVSRGSSGSSNNNQPTDSSDKSERELKTLTSGGDSSSMVNAVLRYLPSVRSLI